MAQHLKCPMCYKDLIYNWDLVTDKKVVFYIIELKKADNNLVKTIKCHNCKRRIKYLIKE